MSKSKIEATSRRAHGDRPRTVRSDEWQRLGEYYRGRAETHRRLAAQASPSALPAHERLAEAYLAAAVASERGEMVQFARDRRAEPPEEEQ